MLGECMWKSVRVFVCSDPCTLFSVEIRCSLPADLYASHKPTCSIHAHVFVKQGEGLGFLLQKLKPPS